MMPSSPELTGGAGFAFEDAVVASYLASVLAGGGARGLGECVADRVSVQREALGQPLDDAVVEGTSRDGQRARLSLQIKQSLRVSSAATNRDFRDVVHRAWRTFRGASFAQGRDRCGGATANISLDGFRAVRATGEWARLAPSAADFFARLEILDFASNAQREYVESLRQLIAETGESARDEELWRFLQHFLVLRFDLRTEGAEDDADAIERVRSVLTNDDPTRAPELWTKLLSLARELAGTAGALDRARLIELLSPVFRFQPRATAARDLRRLAEEADHALVDIRQDIGGMTFARPQLIDAVRAHMATHRVIHVTGEPGSGKSVVLRMLADAQRSDGFALVLKADRLTGPTWAAYAAHHRLETDRLQDLLVELAVSGEPVLYIDGLDRVASDAQGTVRDVLHTVLTTPSLARWRVVATLRDDNIEHVRTWLRDELFAPGIVQTFAVPSFDDAEALQIATSLPQLRPLLFGDSSVSEIARRPFFLGVLARSGSASADATAPSTEAELARVWWRGGGYEADSATARRRQHVLLRLAEHGGHLWGEGTSAEGIDADVVQALLEDGVLREDSEARRVWFRHDIFFEWSFFFVTRARGAEWLDAIRAMGEPPALGRVVELLSQNSLEERADWVAELGRLEAAVARSQWNRAWLLAPFSSPRFAEFRDVVTDAVMAQPEARLEKLFVWFPAVRSVDNPRVLAGDYATPDLDAFQKLLVADLFAWPREHGAWLRFLNWFLTIEGRLDGRQISDALRAVEVWLNAFEEFGDTLTQRVAERLNQWLAELEDGRPRAATHRDWGHHDLDGLESRVRKAFIRAAKQAPALLAQYLERVATHRHVRHDTMSDLIAQSRRIAQIAPAEFVWLCLKEFRAPLPSEESDTAGIFGYSTWPRLDWNRPGIKDHGNDFHPASPVREPFRSLLQCAPREGLRLIRDLLSHSMSAWREMHRFQDEQRRRTTPLPLTLSFPWGEETYWGDVRVYSWFRGGHGDGLLVSALMALEDWAFHEVEGGRDVDDVIRDVVSGNACVATLGIAVALALQTNRVSATTLPLATTQRLWEYDIRRVAQLDSLGRYPNEFAADLFGVDRDQLSELRRINRRPVRRREIRELAMMFTLSGDESLRTSFAAAVARFPQELPFEYAEESNDEAYASYLRRTAEGWSAMADPQHYRAIPTADGRGAQIYFENPRVAEPEVRQALEQRTILERWLQPLNFAHEYLKPRASVPTPEHVRHIIAIARGNDAADLFQLHRELGSLEEMRRSGVAGTAAVALTVAASLTTEDLEWARDVIRRAASFQRRNEDRGRDPDHPAVFASKGLAALIRQLPDELTTKRELVALAFHPNASVALEAIGQAIGCWRENPRFAWAAFRLGLELAVVERPRDLHPQVVMGPDGPEFVDGPNDEQEEEGSAEVPSATDLNAHRVDAVMAWVEGDSDDFSLPTPPAPWSEVVALGLPRPAHAVDAHPEIPSPEEPVRYLLTEWALQVLGALPFEFALTDSRRRNAVLALAEQYRSWTLHKNAASWLPRGRGHLNPPIPPIEWNHGFLRWCAEVGAHLGVGWIRQFLAPIDTIPAEHRAELLQPFVSIYVAITVVDAPILEPTVVSLLVDFVNNVADHAGWAAARQNPLRERGNEALSIIRSVLLADWKGDAPAAARFANGDWREVQQLAPVVDRVLELVGDVPDVLSAFLTHVEKGFDAYSLASFVAQLQRIPTDLWTSRDRWVGRYNAARMAALLQRFVEREQPLPPALHSHVLAILDWLVDIGDRRSAALQVSELLRPRRGVH